MRSSIAAHWKIVFAALVLIGAILRLWNLGGHSLWSDELATWTYSASDSLSDFFQIFRSRDQNPVGYFLLSWVLTHAGLIGDSENSVRAISAASGIIAVVAIFFVTRRAFGLFAALGATFFLAFHYHAVVLSQEARPYSLVILLTILHVGAVFRFLAKDGTAWRSVTLAILTGAAMCYSHAYGLSFFSSSG